MYGAPGKVVARVYRSTPAQDIPASWQLEQLALKDKMGLEKLDQNEADLQRASALVEGHGALRDTVARARHYGAIARDALGIFADGPEKRALVDVVDFCIERAY